MIFVIASALTSMVSIVFAYIVALARVILKKPDLGKWLFNFSALMGAIGFIFFFPALVFTLLHWEELFSTLYTIIILRRLF